MFSFEYLWQQSLYPLKIIDVGAFPIKEKSEIYQPLLDLGCAELIGFEADAAGCARLNAARSLHSRYYPLMIGDGNRHTFYHGVLPFNSSLYCPNHHYLQDFQDYAAVFAVDHTSEVQTVSLDQIPESAGCAFLKLDVQGAELMILKAAPQTLSHVMILQTEVEFEPVYKHQPLFGEVDDFLRQQGFRLHTFQGVGGGAYKPFAIHPHYSRQVLWSDAIYVRDLHHWPHCQPSQLLALATILHHCYQAYDLAAKALQEIDRQTGTRHQSEYLQWLRLLGFSEIIASDGSA